MTRMVAYVYAVLISLCAIPASFGVWEPFFGSVISAALFIGLVFSLERWMSQ